MEDLRNDLLRSTLKLGIHYSNVLTIPISAGPAVFLIRSFIAVVKLDGSVKFQLLSGLIGAAQSVD